MGHLILHPTAKLFQTHKNPACPICASLIKPGQRVVIITEENREYYLHEECAKDESGDV